MNKQVDESPKNDIMFKEIFSDEEILKDFLEALLNEKIERIDIKEDSNFLDNKLDQWLIFIDNKKKELLQMVTEKNKIIAKAEEKRRYLTGEAERERLQELREKAEFDEATAYAEGKERGEKKGKKIGKRIGKRDCPKFA